ncbi:hypothetical protein DAPPUDRAFT_241876 [Daphnia pulex]|uniref:Uncharacterized protein n=1 Tax=Daphnia pulex TaxID=6669 RepID=E9GF99_DAPPU|nr:hypothetical protein DAPPUDRAFT_241876 [Daphnia pulex]|eukprot:EFX81847.1 hypothetical protein DAPPUDRAFT_241876 [Daphnia pulex]
MDWNPECVSGLLSRPNPNFYWSLAKLCQEQGYWICDWIDLNNLDFASTWTDDFEDT